MFDYIPKFLAVTGQNNSAHLTWNYSASRIFCDWTRGNYSGTTFDCSINNLVFSWIIAENDSISDGQNTKEKIYYYVGIG